MRRSSALPREVPPIHRKHRQLSLLPSRIPRPIWRVHGADATYQQAIRAGATSITKVTELFWGDRVGRVSDPFGNIWWLQSKDIR